MWTFSVLKGGPQTCHSPAFAALIFLSKTVNELLGHWTYLVWWLLISFHLNISLLKKKKAKSNKNCEPWLFFNRRDWFVNQRQAWFWYKKNLIFENSKAILLVSEVQAKLQPKHFYWEKIIAIFIFHAPVWVKCPLSPSRYKTRALNAAVVNDHSLLLLPPFPPLLSKDFTTNPPCLGWCLLHIYPVFLQLSISVGNPLMSPEIGPLLSNYPGIPMPSAFLGMCCFFWTFLKAPALSHEGLSLQRVQIIGRKIYCKL